MSHEDHPDAAPDGARVAEVLAQVRAGVRQRHAVAATGTETAQSLRVMLEGTLATPILVPPTPVSHRRWLGRPIVAAKRFVYRCFMRWYLAPLIEFNRSVAAALRELMARQRELQRELAQQ